MAFKKPTPTKAPVVEPTPDPSADEAAKRELHEAAIHHVRNQHGAYANRLRNYDELVFDAKNQIQKSIEDNKTF